MSYKSLHLVEIIKDYIKNAVMRIIGIKKETILWECQHHRQDF